MVGRSGAGSAVAARSRCSRSKARPSSSPSSRPMARPPQAAKAPTSMLRKILTRPFCLGAATVLSVGSAWAQSTSYYSANGQYLGSARARDISIRRCFDFLLRPQRPVRGQLAPHPLARPDRPGRQIAAEPADCASAALPDWSRRATSYRKPAIARTFPARSADLQGSRSHGPCISKERGRSTTNQLFACSASNTLFFSIPSASAEE